MPRDVSVLQDAGDIRGLIRLLGDRDPDTRWQAARALAGFGLKAAPRLERLLSSRNTDLRLGAIEALGAMNDPNLVPALERALHDKKAEVRWAAALALGGSGGQAAVQALIPALSDPEKHVRYGAALSLADLEWHPGNAEEQALLHAGLQEWDEAAKAGPAALKALAAAYADHDPVVRASAVRAAGAAGTPDAIPLIVRALQDADPAVRWEAVQAAPCCGLDPLYTARWLSRRPRQRKNPGLAGFLNFLLPGMGYFYLGFWWGILIFQLDVTATLWFFAYQGRDTAYAVLFPVYVVLAVHAWYLGSRLPDF